MFCSLASSSGKQNHSCQTVGWEISLFLLNIFLSWEAYWDTLPWEHVLNNHVSYSHFQLSEGKELHISNTITKLLSEDDYWLNRKCLFFYAFMPTIAMAGAIVFLVHPSDCPSQSCEHDISRTPWGNFFKFGWMDGYPFGLKDELIRIWWSKVMVTVT